MNDQSNKSSFKSLTLPSLKPAGSDMDYEELTKAGVKTAMEYINNLAFTNAAQKGVVNIPERYCDASLLFSNETDPEIRNGLSGMYGIAKKYVNSFAKNEIKKRTGMLFFGGVGGGKTYAACAVANSLCMLGYSVRYATCSEITVEIADAKSFASKENESLVVKKYVDPDVLVIDELRHLNQMEINIIFNIVEQRDRKNRPVIGISNLSPEKLVLAVGEPTYSRIVGHGGEIVHFVKEDLRMRKASKEVAKLPRSNVIPCYDERTSLFDET